MWDVQKMSSDLLQINSRVKNQFLQSSKRSQPAGNSISGLSFCLSVQEPAAVGIKDSVDHAISEIKDYIVVIWNDNDKREEALEKLQDELNENLRRIVQVRDQLKNYQAERINMETQIQSLNGPVNELIKMMNDTERTLREVMDAYSEASQKGWKIIFYPKLAFKVTGYLLSSKDTILRQKRDEYGKKLDDLFRDKQELLNKEHKADELIRKCFETIAGCEAEVILQKLSLGEFKNEIVKWTNAYIYYSMLKDKLSQLDHEFYIQKEICEDFTLAAVTEQEIEKLLELWRRNENEQEYVQNVLKDMFFKEATPCYGIDTDISFDDREHLRCQFEKPLGVRIMCGYIVDGIEVLYRDAKDLHIHGGLSGSEYVIFFDEDDELACIDGHYGIPFMSPCGDAIGQLVIRTKKGKSYGPFGGGRRDWNRFHIELPQNTAFVGFCGSSSRQGNGGFVSKIGLVYRQLS